MLRWCDWFIVCASLYVMLSHDPSHGSAAEATERRYLLAHYMPWYAAPPDHDRWGWHWTMNHFDPEQQTVGKRAIASRYYPVIGPYDSGNRDVIEYHLLTMKLAGIDGVIVDWYGRTDFRDYALLHRNTTRVIEACEKLQMKFVICYEDQTIPALVNGQRLADTDRVPHAADEIKWLGQYWFRSGSYLKREGAPVLLSFGHAGLTNAEWTSVLDTVDFPVQYFSEHTRRDAATGAFDWPIPQQGISATMRFNRGTTGWTAAIPVAYPRFVDIYAEAGVNDGYGTIPDRGGDTFRETLEAAFATEAPLIQIATWNDWGEGTQIEPSQEFGNRDLQLVQRLRRRHLDREFLCRPADLQIPLQIYQLRTSQPDATVVEELDRVVELLANNKFLAARAGWARLAARLPVESE